MSTAEIAQVVQAYRQVYETLTEKERAVRERAIMAMAKGTTKGLNKFEVLHELTGVEIYVARNRSDVLAIGEAAEVLWKRIHNKEMLTSTGRTIAYNAKKIAALKGKDMSDAMMEALREYDALPVVRTQDGIPYRSGNAKSKPTSDTSEGKFSQIEPGKDREFWLNFRSTMSEYMEKRTEGLDSSTRELLKRSFETDMKIAIDQFLSSIYREQKKAKAQTAIVATAVTRQKVLHACEALHMDPPSVGQPVDMEKARRQKKLLARAYHPDSNGGDSTTQDKYIAVIEAFETLEAFSEQSNAGNPAHRGGDTT